MAVAPITQFGKETRLAFAAVPEGPFVTIAGEKSFDFNRNSSEVDTSDKDGPSSVLTPGVVKFSVSGNVKLPDAGITTVYEAIATGGVIYIEAQKGLSSRYAGPVTVGNWKETQGTDGPVPYSFDVTAAGPATADTLGGV